MTHSEQFLTEYFLNARMDALKTGLNADRPVSRNDVCNYIEHCKASDLLHIMDSVTERMASELGAAIGCEDDRHALLVQVQSEED